MRMQVGNIMRSAYLPPVFQQYVRYFVAFADDLLHRRVAIDLAAFFHNSTGQPFTDLRTTVYTSPGIFYIAVHYQRMHIKRGLIFYTGVQQIVTCQYVSQAFVVSQLFEVSAGINA